MMGNGLNGGELQALIERIEHLEQEKRERAEDIKEVYAEAKSSGYDPKIIRHIVRLRREDASKRAEFEELVELYMNALGDLAETPLGKSAVVREFGIVR